MPPASRANENMCICGHIGDVHSAIEPAACQSCGCLAYMPAPAIPPEPTILTRLNEKVGDSFPGSFHSNPTLMLLCDARDALRSRISQVADLERQVAALREELAIRTSERDIMYSQRDKAMAENEQLKASRLPEPGFVKALREENKSLKQQIARLVEAADWMSRVHPYPQLESVANYRTVRKSITGETAKEIK